MSGGGETGIVSRRSISVSPRSLQGQTSMSASAGLVATKDYRRDGYERVNLGDSAAVRRGPFLIPISESKLRPRSAAAFPPIETFGATDDGYQRPATGENGPKIVGWL